MLPEDSLSSARIISAIIFAIAGLVLFAACSNVANLLSALASTRRPEILVRTALGATRKQLIRETLVGQHAHRWSRRSAWIFPCISRILAIVAIQAVLAGLRLPSPQHCLRRQAL